MKQDNIVVWIRTSLDFMMFFFVWNHMNAIFVHTGKLCQGERMDMIIFFEINFDNDIS